MQSLNAKKTQIDSLGVFAFDVFGFDKIDGPLRNMLLDYKIKVALAITLRKCEQNVLERGF